MQLKFWQNLHTVCCPKILLVIFFGHLEGLWRRCLKYSPRYTGFVKILLMFNLQFYISQTIFTFGLLDVHVHVHVLEKLDGMSCGTSYGMIWYSVSCYISLTVNFWPINRSCLRRLDQECRSWKQFSGRLVQFFKSLTASYWIQTLNESKYRLFN